MSRLTFSFLVAVPLADIRALASHKSELVTQAVLGLELERLRTSRDRKWHLVRLPDGYVGWVRDWSVLPVSRSRLSDWTAGLTYQVTSRSAILREGPSIASGATCELVLGTRLPKLSSQKGWVRTSLPDSRRGWLRRNELGYLARVSATPLAIVRTALLFIGAPYLWGGTTPWGCDCSGLVQTVYAFHGIPLPRDTVDQFRSVRHALIDPRVRRYRRGDLLFFGRNLRGVSHVAVSTGGTSFIHAHGYVRRGDLRRGQSGYLPEVSRHFKVAARPLGKDKKIVDKKSGLQ
ncbi:MAG: hypothetical protein AMJ46_01200 [Latescibacteria bacterium DG_63]|nr:MAG: hypothetical protein AMJ46_01200 [Latescibacteria bacterium DG_63]